MGAGKTLVDWLLGGSHTQDGLGDFSEPFASLLACNVGGEMLQAFGALDHSTARPCGLTISRLIRQVFVHPLLLTTYLLRRP